MSVNVSAAVVLRGGQAGSRVPAQRAPRGEPSVGSCPLIHPVSHVSVTVRLSFAVRWIERHQRVPATFTHGSKLPPHGH